MVGTPVEGRVRVAGFFAHRRYAATAAQAPETVAPFVPHGMEAVHLLASSLRVDRSTTTALRFAARSGSDPVRRAFERLEWEVQVRHHATVDDAFFAFASAVGLHDAALKRALLTLHAAEAEPTREGLERRLDRALDIVTRAEERRRERLASTLERPVAMLLGAGVVLPLVLVSLLPLLQVAQPSLGPVTTGLVLLVAFPAASLLGQTRILDRNNLGAPVAPAEARAAALAASLPVSAAAGAALVAGFLPLGSSLDPVWAAALAGAAGGVAAGVALWRRTGTGASQREAAESELPDLLHAVGAKMAGGRPAEQALLESVEAAPGSVLGERMRGVLFEVLVGRRDLGDALARDEGVASSGRAGPALRLLASAARRDTVEAGRVVQHLAEFERVRLDAAESLRAKVRSVVETARTTAVVFAPLILGVTTGMYGLLSTIPVALATGSPATADTQGAVSFSLTVVLYLMVEACVIEWFASRMLGSDAMGSFSRGLARDLPLAAALFLGAHLAAGALF